MFYLLYIPFDPYESYAYVYCLSSEMIAEDGGDGSLDDFKGVKLNPNSDVMDKLYNDAKAGSDLNLSSDEIEAFNVLGKKASHDEIEQCLRQVLLNRFRAYKKHGLAGIAPYARGKKDFSVGDELKHQLEVGPLLKKYSPVFWKYVMEYPNNKPDGAVESFFWVNSLIDDKPTIALVHRLGMPQDGGYVYVSHYCNFDVYSLSDFYHFAISCVSGNRWSATFI
jgi:hypothetical protein